MELCSSATGLVQTHQVRARDCNIEPAVKKLSRCYSQIEALLQDYGISMFILPDDGATIVISSGFSDKDVPRGLRHAYDAQGSFISSDANSSNA